MIIPSPHILLLFNTQKRDAFAFLQTVKKLFGDV